MHNIQHSQKTDIHTPPGFEPAIPASERPHTNALDRAVRKMGAFYTCTIYIIYYYYYFYLAGCSTFPHLPAPICQLYYLLPPVASVIPVFFH